MLQYVDEKGTYRDIEALTRQFQVTVSTLLANWRGGTQVSNLFHFLKKVVDAEGEG